MLMLRGRNIEVILRCNGCFAMSPGIRSKIVVSLKKNLEILSINIVDFTSTIVSISSPFGSRTRFVISRYGSTVLESYREELLRKPYH